MDDYSDDSHLHAEGWRESFSIYTDFGNESIEVDWDELPALVYLAGQLKAHAVDRGVWKGDAAMLETVTVPREVAALIDRVFLPKNPNKMRSPNPDVLAAVRAFKDIVSGAK